MICMRSSGCAIKALDVLKAHSLQMEATALLRTASTSQLNSSTTLSVRLSINRLMRNTFVALAALLLAAPVWAADLPDPVLTPGVTNPDVTQDNIRQTVCVRGYSKSIRPPAYFTNKLKRQQIREYGYADTNPRDYEEDHLIALSIGGAPRNPRNLWPEPWHSEWNAKKKDQLEFVLFRMVCEHEISLADAQHAMATNWIKAWNEYVPNHPNYRFKGGRDWVK